MRRYSRLSHYDRNRIQSLFTSGESRRSIARIIGKVTALFVASWRVMQEGVSAMRGRGHSAFRKDASRVKRSSLTRYKAFWKRKSALDFKRSTARNRLQIRSVAVVPPRLLPYIAIFVATRP